MTTITRRSWLLGASALVAAPAISRAPLLGPPLMVRPPSDYVYEPFGAIIWWDENFRWITLDEALLTFPNRPIYPR